MKAQVMKVVVDDAIFLFTSRLLDAEDIFAMTPSGADFTKICQIARIIQKRKNTSERIPGMKKEGRWEKESERKMASRSENFSEKSKLKRFKCHHCGKRGRVQADCWVKHPEKKQSNKAQSLREDLVAGIFALVVALDTQAAISVVRNNFPTRAIQVVEKKTKFWWGNTAIVNDKVWKGNSVIEGVSADLELVPVDPKFLGLRSDYGSFGLIRMIDSVNRVTVIPLDLIRDSSMLRVKNITRSRSTHS